MDHYGFFSREQKTSLTTQGCREPPGRRDAKLWLCLVGVWESALLRASLSSHEGFVGFLGASGHGHQLGGQSKPAGRAVGICKASEKDLAPLLARQAGGFPNAAEKFLLRKEFIQSSKDDFSVTRMLCPFGIATYSQLQDASH